jgi:hypothetical protein
MIAEPALRGGFFFGDPMIHDTIKEALADVRANGDEQRFRALSLTEQAMDVHNIQELEELKFKVVYDALLEVLLETDVAYFLNKMQLENRKHRLLDPAHAIRFALTEYDGLDFLKRWNEGDWAGCSEWVGWKEFS